MAESFDAVLAEMREWADRYESNGRAALATNLREYAGRLQSAHAAEVAEVRESARHEAVAMGLLADRAVGLLRIIQGAPASGLHEWLPMIDAFLSEQAGERENGDG